MFEHACRWYRIHLERGGSPVSLAVNVSKAGLFQNDFVDFYTDIKDKYSVPDGVLELEFTESILAADTELFAELVVNLNARGFICSLDDFGSGYSSLNLLKNCLLYTSLRPGVCGYGSQCPGSSQNRGRVGPDFK